MYVVRLLTELITVSSGTFQIQYLSRVNPTLSNLNTFPLSLLSNSPRWPPQKINRLSHVFIVTYLTDPQTLCRCCWNWWSAFYSCVSWLISCIMELSESARSSFIFYCGSCQRDPMGLRLYICTGNVNIACPGMVLNFSLAPVGLLLKIITSRGIQ